MELSLSKLGPDLQINKPGWADHQVWSCFSDFSKGAQALLRILGSKSMGSVLINWLWCVCPGFSVNICSKCCLYSETNSITLRVEPWPRHPPRAIPNMGGHLVAPHRETTPLTCTVVIPSLLHGCREHSVPPGRILQGSTKIFVPWKFCALGSGLGNKYEEAGSRKM